MEVLAAHKQDPDHKFHVVGGTMEMVAVLGDLGSLYLGQIPKTGELSGFATWAELREFTESPLGSAYAPLVNLVEMVGGSVSGIIGVLKRSQFRPEDVDLIVRRPIKQRVYSGGGQALRGVPGRLGQCKSRRFENRAGVLYHA